MTIPVTRMSELSTGAQLLLWATRHIVAAAIRGSGVPWCVEKSFQIAGARPASEALQSLIVAMARSTPRQLTVGRPSSARLTADEVLLAHALVGPPAETMSAPRSEAPAEDLFARARVADALEEVREAMEGAGLPLTRLGMPGVGHLRAGRAPVLFANPGMADVH